MIWLAATAAFAHVRKKRSFSLAAVTKQLGKEPHRNKQAFIKSWDGSASCNASDGELAAVGYSGSV